MLTYPLSSSTNPVLVSSTISLVFDLLCQSDADFGPFIAELLALLALFWFTYSVL